MTVKAILSTKGTKVVTIRPGATLSEVVTVLAQHRIGALVVADDDRRLLGIISERDIVRLLHDKGAAALSVAVQDVMTRKVVTCTPNETIAEIMELMTARKFRHVPVVETGRLIGIISIGDVVKARLGEFQQEHEALRDYIQTA